MSTSSHSNTNNTILLTCSYYRDYFTLIFHGGAAPVLPFVVLNVCAIVMICKLLFFFFSLYCFISPFFHHDCLLSWSLLASFYYYYFFLFDMKGRGSSCTDCTVHELIAALSLRVFFLQSYLSFS